MYSKQLTSKNENKVVHIQTVCMATLKNHSLNHGVQEANVSTNGVYGSAVLSVVMVIVLRQRRQDKVKKKTAIRSSH